MSTVACRMMAALFLFTGASAIAVNATLTWDPSPSGDVAAYRVYYGTASRTYTQAIDVGLATSVTVSNLSGGITYYFAVTAVDSYGLESDFSNEVVYTPPEDAVSFPTQVALSAAAGQVHLRATAPPGSSHTIQCSDDMKTWTDLNSVTADSTGQMEFVDDQAAKHQQRFYRFKESSP